MKIVKLPETSDKIPEGSNERIVNPSDTFLFIFFKGLYLLT